MWGVLNMSQYPFRMLGRTGKGPVRKKRVAQSVWAIWDSCSMGRCRESLGSSLAAESLSLHKASERRHRAGREFGQSYPRQKRGKNWAAGGWMGLLRATRRENKVTAEINRPELLLKDPTDLFYWAPVNITQTLQTPLWTLNGYDALFWIVFGIRLKS